MQLLKLNSRNVRIIFSVGILLTILGSGLVLFWRDFYKFLKIKLLLLSSSSLIYDRWANPGNHFEEFIDVYFFNWTNPDDLGRNKSSKPILEEVGPIRFLSKVNKVNITWHDENSTVDYRRLARYYFVKEASKISLDDKIKTVNIAAITAISQVEFGGFFAKKKVHFALSLYNQQLAIVKTVRELLFDGYSDSLLNAAKTLKMMDNEGYPYDKIGYFYKKNNTLETTKVCSVNTGASDMREYGNLLKYNYQSETDKFSGDCKKIEGSAGDLFPNPLKEGEPIKMFLPDVFRKFQLDYEDQSEINGVKVFKFVGGESLVDNGTKFPENLCYSTSSFLPSGVFNSTDFFGMPLFWSYPHYLHGDRFYLDQVEGLNPSKDTHEFFITVDPDTGIPVQCAYRFQLVIPIRGDPRIGLVKNVQDVYIPTLWFNLQIKLNEKTINDLKRNQLMPQVGNVIGIIFSCFGILFVIGGIFTNLISQKTKKLKRNFQKSDSEKCESPLLRPKIQKSKEPGINVDENLTRHEQR